MKNSKRSGYTLFELLAVLTVSGIIFTVVMGSWNSWSTVQACNGATGILKSEFRQARALAMAKNRYVGMLLESHTANQVQQITSCQLYLYTNDTENAESRLGRISSTKPAGSVMDNLFDEKLITPTAPLLQLSSHISISSYTEDSSPESGVILFFRPDGSIWNGENSQFHYIAINSRRLFNEQPLSRLLQIDLTTGTVNIIRKEDL